MSGTIWHCGEMEEREANEPDVAETPAPQLHLHLLEHGLDLLALVVGGGGGHVGPVLVQVQVFHGLAALSGDLLDVQHLAYAGVGHAEAGLVDSLLKDHHVRPPEPRFSGGGTALHCTALYCTVLHCTALQVPLL